MHTLSHYTSFYTETLIRPDNTQWQRQAWTWWGGVLAHVQCRLAPPKWTRLVKNQRVTCAKIFDFWSLLHYCSQNLSTMSANGFSLWGTWSPRPHRGPGHHQGFIPAPQWKLVPSTWATVKLPGVATQHSYINSTTHLSYRRRPHIRSYAQTTLFTFHMFQNIIFNQNHTLLCQTHVYTLVTKVLKIMQ